MSISMSFTAGGSYGLYKHVLTKEEIATHKHQYSPKWVSEAPSNTGIFGMLGEGDKYTYGGGVEPVGESTPFDIIQPSLCVYIWKRVS